MNPLSLVLRGVLAFILGIILIVWPGSSLSVLLILFPIFVIIDGISAIIIGASTAKEGKWLSFIPMGILEIFISIFVFIWPDVTVYAFVLLIALWAFVVGLGELFLAIFDDMLKTGARLLYGLGGAITFALGISVLIYPLITSLVLLWLFGMFFLIYGVFLLVIGLLALHHIPHSSSK